MHILILTDAIFPDRAGGIAKSTYNTCRALTKSGHRVTTLARTTLPRSRGSSVEDGIEIHRFVGVRPTHPFYNLLYPVTVPWCVARWLKQQDLDTDVIFVHHPLHLLGSLLTWHRHHAPLAYFYHASMAAEIAISAQAGKYGAVGKITGPLTDLLCRFEGWILRQADAVFTASAFTRQDLRRRYGIEATGILAFGVDTEFYKPAPMAEVRHQLGLPADRQILLTVRRLVGRMGLINLVRSMALVQKMHPDTLLLIAGQGHLRASIEDLVRHLELEDSVRLLGFVPEEELPALMAAADLFVLPTEQLEGFGMATIEALACGLPVLGTAVGATPEILAPIDARLITRDQSPSGIAQGIEFWLSQREELTQLRARCREAALVRYDAYTNAQLLVSQFEQLSTGEA